MPTRSNATTIRRPEWYGWIPDLPDQRDQLYGAVYQTPKKLPLRIDLRADFPAIDYQGQLGSCTANALVGALEFLERKADPEKRPIDLSRLFIYYNERVIEHTTKQDSGAMLRDGIKCLAKQGVCSENQWPYIIKQFAKKPPPACYAQAKAYTIDSYQRLLTLEEMRACLADAYPFVFGFTAYESFESAAVAKSGTLNLPKKSERAIGGHAVCAVGYDDELRRFIVRNSWGVDWGKQGYFTMPYAYLEDRSLSDDFWTIRG